MRCKLPDPCSAWAAYIFLPAEMTIAHNGATKDVAQISVFGETLHNGLS
jgi:hypothetical protein